jgi:hypothetical protein
MDEHERLRRRTALYRRPLQAGANLVHTARYLEEVQRETASRAGANEDPLNVENAGPAYLRARAAHYRELAKQQTDPKRAQLFSDLARSFEAHAIVKERNTTSRN